MPVSIIPEDLLISGSLSGAPSEVHYFAFGSNLHLAQMAARCPESLYMGRAQLPGFQWQINERGYANIVKTDEDTSVVEGLCYRLTDRDVQRLDVNEGVSHHFYEHLYVDVDFFLAGIDLAGRKVAQIVEEDLLHPSPVPDSRSSSSIHLSPSAPPRVKMLAYVSGQYTTDGEPKTEYVKRMNDGIVDALLLGVSKEYVNKYIRPHIPEENCMEP